MYFYFVFNIFFLAYFLPTSQLNVLQRVRDAFVLKLNLSQIYRDELLEQTAVLGEKCFVEIAEKQFHISTSQCSSLSVMFYSWNIHKEMFVYIIVSFVEFLFVTLFFLLS